MNAPRFERRVRSGIALRAGMSLSDLDLEELWIAYVGLGGSMPHTALVELMNGQLLVSDHEHDVIAQALNDYFTSKGQDHPVAYSSELDDQPRTPDGGH
jgi:hypothetical protein